MRRTRTRLDHGTFKGMRNVERAALNTGIGLDRIVGADEA